jgi:uncharacterized damage-inducible protein DinB
MALVHARHRLGPARTDRRLDGAHAVATTVGAAPGRRNSMKNVREYYRECFDAEKPKFVRVLEAVPPDQAGYRPHPRSTSAGDLVWLLATELGHACELVDRGEVSFAPHPAPSVPESIATYERNAQELERRLTRLDDAKWEGKARLLMDGKVMWEAPLGDMLFGFLFDAIHHRGQLSTYLRPMGAKVPSIYGPSADDPGM